MFRFAFSPRSRVACLGCAAALLCLADIAPARAAWPLGSGGDVVLGYATTYTRDGRDTVHTGVDLSARAAESVLSPVAGQVSFAGRVPAAEGTMLAVTIQTEDGFLVTLMPLSATALTAGRAVGAGDSLGQLAADGDVSSDESHLHVGVRRGERYLDPLPVLGSPPVTSIADSDPEAVVVDPPAAEAEPLVGRTVPAQGPSDAVVQAAQQGLAVEAQADSSEIAEGLFEERSTGDARSTEVAAGSNAGAIDSLRRAQPAVAVPADVVPPAVRRRRTFQDAHAGSSADSVVKHPSEWVVAGGALLGAGLLALWPLWRGKRHPVPDVRPEINDVAAAVSR